VLFLNFNLYLDYYTLNTLASHAAKPKTQAFRFLLLRRRPSSVFTGPSSPSGFATVICPQSCSAINIFFCFSIASATSVFTSPQTRTLASTMDHYSDHRIDRLFRRIRVHNCRILNN
ncbi:hypothetical protein U1Q18_000086, partial [Sarracenia purpurea var. burkii]